MALLGRQSSLLVKFRTGTVSHLAYPGHTVYLYGSVTGTGGYFRLGTHGLLPLKAVVFGPENIGV